MSGFTDITEQNFDTLFALALSEWPKKLELRITRVDPKDNRYSVDGLGSLVDQITGPWLQRREEVLMRGLHDAIQIVVHQIAVNCTVIEMASLRKETVQSIFEQRLTPAWGGEDLDWNEEDKRIVKEYFLRHARAS